MSNLVAYTVHYREDGKCVPAVVTHEYPYVGPYCQLDLISPVMDGLGGVVWVEHKNVDQDPAVPEDTAGFWHDRGSMDCPEWLP